MARSHRDDVGTTFVSDQDPALLAPVTVNGTCNRFERDAERAGKSGYQS